MYSKKPTKIHTHIIFFILLLSPFVVYGAYTLYEEYFTSVSTVGVHAMADGTVMNAKGEILPDAKVMQDGTIQSKDGKVIGSMYLGTPFTTETESLPTANSEPEMVYVHDGDTFELTAAYVQKEVGNRRLRMLAYNNSVPGPIIKVDQGAEVTINFNNNTDIEQTIHSHGIRIDNAYDGVPNETQDAVKPGETFSYKVHFPDAGVFWYHPHTREDYGQEMGLYGNYIVEPENAIFWTKVHREAPLVVDDILIRNDKIETFYKELTNFALLGRFGNTHLVNGEVDYVMPVTQGEVIRFYITNVANARTYNLAIPGAKIKLVGADLGRYEHETFVDSILISPAERSIVEVYFPKEGRYALTHTSPTGAIEIAHFKAEGSVVTSYLSMFNTLRTNSEEVTVFHPLRQYKYKAPDKKVLLTVAITGPKIDHSKHVHTLAGSSTPLNGLPNLQWDDVGESDMTNTTQKITWQVQDKQTQRTNMDITDWNFRKGDLVKIQIQNDPNAVHVMQHPFHMHGQRFVVLDRNGVPNDNMVWKDTILVEPGELVNILVQMDNPGLWMAHCHIAEHLHAGMMFNFSVANEDGSIPGEEYRNSVEHATGH